MSRRPMKGSVVAMICPSHGFIHGDYCGECRLEKKEGPAVHTFKSMVYHDICETPLLIESKRQLREECRKHNVRACRLM
jgi:hypothetical protein